MVTNPNNNSYLFPNDYNGTLGAFSQAPSASTAYTLDYSDWLAAGVSIASVSYVVTPSTSPALVVTNSMITAIGANASEGIAFLVSGGIAGQRYTVAPTITLTDGSAKTDQFAVSCIALQGTPIGVSASVSASGANFLAGDGAPTSADGGNGDFYLDMLSSLVYGPKTSGAWPSPATVFGGANFIGGSTTGNPPSNAIGANGNFFIDLSSGLVFGPKAAGVWPGSGSAITTVASANTITGNSAGVAPSSGTGVNGNYFHDLDSSKIFGPKATGAWPATGVLVDAANIIYGNSAGSAPSNTVGLNGNYFLDLSSGKVYGPKASGAWPATTGSLFPLLSNSGAANGVATLDGTGKLPTSQLTAAVLRYKGGWNASTNSPALASGTGTSGDFYKVTTAGSTTLDGNGPWSVGDELWFDGTVWNRLGSSATTTGGQSTLPQGRLTLTSNTPVLSDTTVSAATSVFYTPYVGNLVPVWNGSQFVATIFVEVSQALSDTTKSPGGAAANNVYDLFVWSDSGTIRCTRGPSWQTGSGSNTVRGIGVGSTALTRVNGVLVNANAITNGPAAHAGTYVGTIRTDVSGVTITYNPQGGTVNGAVASLPIWNMYNRVLQRGLITLSGPYTYSSSSVRVAGGDANNTCKVVYGLAEAASYISMVMNAQTVAASGANIAFVAFNGSVGTGFVSINAVGSTATFGNATAASAVGPLAGAQDFTLSEVGDGTNANTVLPHNNGSMTFATMM